MGAEVRCYGCVGTGDETGGFEALSTKTYLPSQRGEDAVPQQMRKLAVRVRRVDPGGVADFGGGVGCVGGDGAGVGEDGAHDDLARLVGGGGVEGAELVEALGVESESYFFGNFAQGGVDKRLALLGLAAGQLVLGGGLLAHGEDLARGVADDDGCDFNHGCRL